MYAVETTFGQCYKQMMSKRYSSISQRLWGFSFGQLMVSMISNLYYVVLMAWSVSYFFLSFQTPLPWKKTTNFLDVAVDPLESEESSADLANEFFNEAFFSDKLLQKTSSISESGGIVPLVFASLFVSYVLVYFSVWKGVESTGKIVYVTAILPYALMIILLLRGLSLEGAWSGISYLFYPDFSKLGTFTVWYDAVNQILFSSGIAFGPLVFYGSCRQPSERIMKSSVCLPLINSFTSLLSACVLFAFLGHVSTTLGIEIQDIQIEGIELAFVAYPAMLTMLPGSNIWSVVFFIMLVTVGIDSIFGTFDYMQNFLLTEFPVLKRKIRKEYFALILVVGYFTCGIMFTFKQGFYIFEIFDHYSVGLPVLFLFTCEVYILGWKFSMSRLNELLMANTGESFTTFHILNVKYLLLAIMITTTAAGFVMELSNPLELPWWAFSFGWILMAAPIILSLVGLCVPKRRLLGKLGKYCAKEIDQYGKVIPSEQLEYNFKGLCCAGEREELKEASFDVRNAELEAQEANVKELELVESPAKHLKGGHSTPTAAAPIEVLDVELEVEGDSNDNKI